MSDDIENLAVQRAAYAGMRWHDLNEGGREHYRRLVRYDIEWRKANPSPSAPTMTLPFSFGDKRSADR